MRSSTIGDRLGPNVGSSLEFQDYRDYTPGDDPRHVDWAAYARRDELVVRLHKEEVTAHLDVILDTSRSMASTTAKKERAIELTRLLVFLGETDKLRTTLWLVGGDALPIRGSFTQHIQTLSFDSPQGLESLIQHGNLFPKQGIRVVISDFLCQHTPADIVRPLQRDAARCTLIQLLDRNEHSPSQDGGRRLTDVETGETLDIILNDQSTAEYLKRLEALTKAYRRQIQATGGLLIRTVADDELMTMCRGPLLDGGLLVPRHAGGSA